MRYTLIFKNIPGTQHEWWEDTLHRICPHSKLFWPTFSRIWTEYGEIRSPYSVRIWENADKNNSEYTYFSRSEYTHFSRSEYTHFSRSDTSWFLANFITCELDLPYSFEEIDFQISWAHRSTKHDRDHRNKTKWGPQPIFAQFVNCCIAKKKKEKPDNWIKLKTSHEWFCQPNVLKRVDTTMKWWIKVLSWLSQGIFKCVDRA